MWSAVKFPFVYSRSLRLVNGVNPPSPVLRNVEEGFETEVHVELLMAVE